MEYDPLLGWRKTPNHRGVITSPFDEFRVVQEINSRGIRGPEYPYEKKQGELRILMLRDSFTQGDMVPFKELSSEVLKARLNDAGQGTYEVINAGTSGYSKYDQELVFFQSEGSKYSPDLTMVMVYHNDIWWNLQPKYWRGHKPLFRLQEGKLHLVNVPLLLPDPSPRPTELAPTEGSPLRKLKHWLSQKSML